VLQLTENEQMKIEKQAPRNPYELSSAQKAYDLRRRLWRWAQTLGLCLLFYLLTTGPVCRLVDGGWLPDKALKAFAPLVWVMEQSWGAWLDIPLRYYVSDLWHAPPLE
jgi:hypothetical protein